MHGLWQELLVRVKSEILQSYILSMAVNFSPEDVGFLTIDFKVEEWRIFSKISHMLGSITNLDGAASARALAAQSRVTKTPTTICNQFGVNHINGYTKL